MLGAVRFVSREALAASSKEEDNGRKKEKADVDDPEMLAKRKNAGLEWMSVPPTRTPVQQVASQPEVPSTTEETHVNPKELNPYFKEDGDGYPEEKKNVRQLEGIGDGGASFMMKKLKRAQEQALREGKSLPDIIEDRCGSSENIFAGITGRRAAHHNAHLHAIWDRKRQYENAKGGDSKDDKSRMQDDEDDSTRGYRSRMKAPRLDDSLKWKSRSREPNKQMRSEDAAVLRAAASSYNKYDNDGSFLEKFKEMEKAKAMEKDKASNIIQDNEEPDGADTQPARQEEITQTEDVTQKLNQIAAKAMRLRLMGKTKEADELLKQGEALKSVSGSSKDSRRSGDEAVMKSITARQKHTEEKRGNLDMVLASKIYKSKERYGADDEYDDVGIETDAQKRKSEKKNASKSRNATVSQYKRIQTQNERCQFCFENPSRPKQLTIAIGNFTYLMLPSTAALVPGHCYIVPSQHEGSTRNVDDDVWEEIRNFKKCLLRMFNEQEKEVIFMETALKLSQQRRHCLVECIPVPPDVLKSAPLYFKKAIDEVEDEWSQHNAKKLIDTRGKGLRSCIPKNFPYFNVEFGLEGGYCHVIDDEAGFNINFGRNVLIGMLKLPQESMHQRARKESLEQQKVAVKEFSQQWKPHDWTKMLE